MTKKKQKPTTSEHGSIAIPVGLELVKISELVPYERNARTHSDHQVEQISASMKEFGFTNPILIDDDLGVIAGHGRMMAAQSVGLVEVPVVRLSHLTPTQRRAYVLADNQLALNAGWDTDLLPLELGELFDAGFDVDLLGFDEKQVASMLATEGETDPDDVPEVQADPVTREGDVWVMGKHRVMCGDCRNASDVGALIGSDRVTVAFTSPPYASQRKYDETTTFKPIPPGEYAKWFDAVQCNVLSVLADDGSWFVNIKEHCHDGQRHLYVKDLTITHVRQWGWHFVDEFCWRDTKNGVPGKWSNRFKDAWEPVFHFTRGGGVKFNPLANGTASNAVFEYSPDNGTASTGSGLLGSSRALPSSKGVARPSNVLEIASASTGNHSAAFPVELPAWFVRAFSDPGDVVFDPFMGSGTTLVACENESRRGRGMEISPAYVDVIVRRWEAFTGSNATLEGDGRTFKEVEGDGGQ